MHPGVATIEVEHTEVLNAGGVGGHAQVQRILRTRHANTLE